MKEPKAVVEARAALRARLMRMVPIIGVMMLGWLPVIPLEQAGSGGDVFMGIYMLLALLGTGAIVWDEHRTNWARTLVDTWDRNQAQRTLEDVAGTQTGRADVPAAVIMGRIREHLEVDRRALGAAEAAYGRMRRLADEEAAARTALEGLPAGGGHDQLTRAADRLRAEVEEIQGTLAALYATLISRAASPTASGLKDTLLELEAEAEVADALLRTRGGGEQEATDPGARRQGQAEG